MDGLTLLRRARDAGLAIATDNDKLVIRGPKRAEAIARLLIERKPEVMAALAGAERTSDGANDRAPGWWRRHYLIRTINWGLSGRRSRAEAKVLAYGGCLNCWRRLHGTRAPQWQCAGCGEPISGLAALDLADGNRVHLGARGLDCLLSFGERWRSEATAGLRTLGLDPPSDFDAV